MDVTSDVDQNSYGSRQDTAVGLHERNTEHLWSISFPRRPLPHSASYMTASNHELKTLHPLLTEN